MKATDLAYAAALVDSLAVLKVRRYQGTDLPVVAITTTKYGDAVRWLGRSTGTKLSALQKDYTHRGCNEHCPDKHNHVISEGARWQITGAKATIVLHNLLPYMRFQTSEARRLIRQGQVIGYKGDVVRRMAALGWAIPDLKPQPRARVAVAS